MIHCAFVIILPMKNVVSFPNVSPSTHGQRSHLVSSLNQYQHQEDPEYSDLNQYMHRNYVDLLCIMFQKM